MNVRLPKWIADEIFVDNFAGGGGASTGAEHALGRPIDEAINHDWHALGMHRTNHPQTIHHCEDVFDVNPVLLVNGRRIGGAWFSPDCKHFSKAKGGKPVSKKIRGLAFVIFRYAKIHARVIYMENVEEIQTWGPLLPDGKPDPKHRGRTWQAFLAVLGPGIAPDHPDIPHILRILNYSRNAQRRVARVSEDMRVTREDLIQGFGYDIQTRELRACDYGSPTIRKRLFMVARCDGRPIVWPQPTHFAPNDPRPGPRWRTIAECIDWTLPCHSIFLNRAQARKVNCRRPLAKSTLRRIATGLDRFVLKSARPFMVSLTHHGGDRVEDIDAPGNTITGAHRGEKALVVGRIAHGEKSQSGKRRGRPGQEMSEPLGTQTASNEFALVSANMARDFGQSIGSPADAPAPTVMPDGQGKTKLVQTTLAPVISEMANTSNNRSMPADEPMRTQCAQVKGGHFSLVSAHMIQKGHSNSNSQMVKGADEPMRTQTANAEHSVVTAHLAVQTTGHPGYNADAPGATILAGGKHHALVTGSVVGVGGPARTESPLGAPSGTIITREHKTIVTGTIVGAGGPARSGEPQPVDKPSGTVLSARATKALAAASMVKLRGENIGDSPNAPMHTASAGGQHHGIVSANVVGFHGNDKDGQPMDAPGKTTTAKEKYGLVNASFLAQANDGFNKTPGHEATKPASTISGTGSQQQLVTANTIAYYGTETDGQSPDESMRTASTKPRFGLVESEIVQPGLTPEQIAGARRVAAFLRSFGIKFEGEFATITVDGIQFVLVDIGMRMLTPRELFRAQGFPERYIIDHAILVDPKTGRVKKVALTKEQQIRMCGNSVCPQVAEALIRANSSDMVAKFRRQFQTDLILNEAA